MVPRVHSHSIFTLPSFVPADELAYQNYVIGNCIHLYQSLKRKKYQLLKIHQNYILEKQYSNHTLERVLCQFIFGLQIFSFINLDISLKV